MTCNKAEGRTFPKMNELADTLIHISGYHTGDERGAGTDDEAVDVDERLHRSAIFIHGAHDHNDIPYHGAPPTRSQGPNEAK